MVSVIVHHSSGSGTPGIDQALKSLQRKIQRDAIIRTTKNAKHHEKPSIKKKRKREESDRRRKKMSKKMRTDVNYRNFVLFADLTARPAEPTSDVNEEPVA